MKAALTLLGLGLLSLGLHAALILNPPASGLETLPIFVPASLEEEVKMRAERGQEAGRGGLEPLELAQVLLAERFDARRSGPPAGPWPGCAQPARPCWTRETADTATMWP